MGKYADMLLGPSEQPKVQGGKWSNMLLGEPATGNFTGSKIPGPREAQTPPGTITRNDVVLDTDAGASIGTAAKAGFADDPETKVRYYASQRFPDLPIDQAMKRYTVVDGDIAYQGDDGRFYSETPGFARSLAEGSSKALPIAAGGITAVATAPMWLAPGGGVLASELTALAAGAGETGRQIIGNKMLEDPVSFGEVGKEMAFSMAGDAAGGLATKAMGRKVASDIGRMDRAGVEDLQGLSQQHKVDLTPAELTNLPSLKARQKALSNLSDSADQMGDFYINRAGQVDDAVSKELNAISPIDSAEQAGMLGRDAAGNAIKGARKERSDAAAPLYQFVNDPNTLVPDRNFSSIKGDKFLAKEIEEVKKSDLLEMGGHKDNSLPVLDEVKKRLDGRIAETKNPNERRLLRNKRDALLKATDEAFPDYALARAAFAGDSPAVDGLEKGAVGIISKLKDTNAKDAASALFNPSKSGPRQVVLAKNAIQKTDPEAWQALKRAYLEDAWQKASKESMSNPGLNRGGKYRAMLFGDKKQDIMLKTMLEPSEYESLSGLAKVLEASGRVKSVGSDTAWNQELMKIERDNARPLLAKVASAMRVTSWPKMVEEWATEKAVRKNAAQMAHVITSPDGISALKELSQVSPGSAKAAVLTSYLLGIGSRVAYAESGSQDQQ